MRVTHLLKHHEYANLRVLSWNNWAFYPLNKEGHQVLFDPYRDAIDATPGSICLHVGGGEMGNVGLYSVANQLYMMNVWLLFTSLVEASL